MNIESNELATAFTIIGLYCLEKADCNGCNLKALCEGQVEDALYEFALRAALKV